MIRRWLHKRWYAKYGINPRLFDQLNHWKWIDHYFDWDVRTFGETPGNQPWWDQIVGRFVCWLADWRTTLFLRPKP